MRSAAAPIRFTVMPLQPCVVSVDLQEIRRWYEDSKNSIGMNTMKNIKNLISPAGAAFTLLCFILPWYSASALWASQSILGIQSGPFGWLVAFAAMGIITLVLIFVKAAQPTLARIFAIAGAGSAMVLMLIQALVSSGSYGLASVSMAVGWYGSFLGLIIALAGAFFIEKIQAA